ncbi:hypothetical protein WME89_00975 [Sorangium sp. So ce321]
MRSARLAPPLDDRLALAREGMANAGLEIALRQEVAHIDPLRDERAGDAG